MHFQALLLSVVDSSGQKIKLVKCCYFSRTIEKNQQDKNDNTYS